MSIAQPQSGFRWGDGNISPDADLSRLPDRLCRIVLQIALDQE